MGCCINWIVLFLLKWCCFIKNLLCSWIGFNHCSFCQRGSVFSLIDWGCLSCSKASIRRIWSILFTISFVSLEFVKSCFYCLFVLLFQDLCIFVFNFLDIDIISVIRNCTHWIESSINNILSQLFDSCFIGHFTFGLT